jgi:hypothetical protein
MHLRSAGYLRWEAMVLIIVWVSIFIRLQTLLFPIADAFVIFVAAMICGETQADVRIYLDAARAGNEPAQRFFLPPLVMALVSSAIWLLSAIATLGIMSIARDFAERAIDTFSRDHSD